MDLRAYLIHHDGKLSKLGRELHRLSKKAKCTPLYTYTCALRLKTPSRGLANRFHLASKDRAIDAAAVLGLLSAKRRRTR